MGKEKFTVGVLLEGKLARAMQRERAKTLAAYAAITRAALVEYLRARGYDVEDTIEWGGLREAPTEEGESPQEVPVLA